MIIEAQNWTGYDSSADGKRWEDYDTIKCPNGQVIDMQKLLNDQSRAQVALVNLMPVFRGFVSRLRFIYTFKVQTQATDGFNILVNPQFTYNLSMSEKVFVMAHEIMHCLLNHLRRGKGHDHTKSNIAADYEVNITLVEMGLASIGDIKKIGALVDEKYKNWGYEKIYADNPSGPKNGDMSNSKESKNAEKNQKENQKGSGDGSGSAQYSGDYKKGWAKAMEDYKNGKLKL